MHNVELKRFLFHDLKIECLTSFCLWCKSSSLFWDTLSRAGDCRKKNFTAHLFYMLADNLTIDLSFTFLLVLTYDVITARFFTMLCVV